MTLPEPGRSLFERTIGILNRHFRHGRRSAGFILGGGTLLGGRWGPIRRSHDIDVKVSPHPDHRIMVTAQGRVHVQDMSETEGWTGTFSETAK